MFCTANCVPCDWFCTFVQAVERCAADDPAFFGARSAHGLLHNFIVARHLIGLNDSALAELAKNSLLSTCLPKSEAAIDAKINQWLLGL